MGLRIHTNVQSMTAQRELESSRSAQQSSLERLASGSRVNRASDDAAGLSISEKLRAEIRSNRASLRNASDGVSMLQTAEGGMNEIGNILIRFRELAIQASSDTIGDTERGFLQKEVDQLRAEVVRISSSTEYNGIKLLGSGADVREIQVGINNNPDTDRFYYDVLQSNLRADDLGLPSISLMNKDSARDSLSAIDSAIQRVSGTRAQVGAMQNRLESAVRSIQISDESLSSARSRIADTDVAQETADLTRNNILTMSGSAVLAQANQSGMLAIKLLS